MKKQLFIALILLALFILACSRMSSDDSLANIPANQRTNNIELDRIISAFLSGDVAQQRAYLQFSPRPCTNAEGLGGPPKCLEGEQPGTLVEALPFLGPEGSFLRKADVQTWPGLSGLKLYAVYLVSGQAYSEPDYPAGEYAIVFTTPQTQSNITVQVRDGRIVRIDNIFGNPPEIPAENVARYLIAPLH